MGLAKPVSPVLQRGNSLANGLVGGWPFYEGAGNRAYDLSGNNNTGTLTSGPTWAGSPFGQAIKFTAASSQYIDCGNNPSLQITGTITIAALVMFASINNFQIVAKDNDTGGRAYTFDYALSQQLRFYINGGGSSIVVSDTFVPNIGQWYHVAGTFIPSGAMAVYIDGKQRGGATAGDSSIPSATTNCRIGARAYTGFNGFFDGAMAGVQMWNRALPADEIAQDYFDPFAIYRSRTRFAQFVSASAPPAACAPTLSLLGVGCGIQAARAMIRNRTVGRRGVVAELLGVNDE